MTTQNESMEFYNLIRENRMAMYSKPRRYYNRDGEQGSAFKFLFLVEVMVFFMLMASGATFLEITKGTFNKIDILVPPESIMNRFTDMACPLFKQIEILQEQIDILTKTRNLLLPRLISGKLSLKQAEATIN